MASIIHAPHDISSRSRISTNDESPTDSPMTASIRRLFSPPQPPSSPYTPGSLIMLSRNIEFAVKEKSLKEKEGEVFSMQNVQLFFKNVSDSLHLQEEINDINTDTADQKDLEGNLAAGNNGKDCKEEDQLSGYFYEETSEDLKDHSTLPTNKDTCSKYALAESHPFFDGRFIEIDGLIQYDSEWREKQQTAKKKRRWQRRSSAWRRNTIAAKVA